MMKGNNLIQNKNNKVLRIKLTKIVKVLNIIDFLK